MRALIGLEVFALILVAQGLSSQATASEVRPNVIFLLTDDQNDDTLGCFGGKVLTPNLDRLAREGVRFTRAYASASVCTPSRYTCLTGQYASRCQSERFLNMCPPGTQSNVGFNVSVTPGSLNIGKVLHDAGYTTGFVGKWHTGAPPLVKYEPNADMTDPEVAKILAENQRRMVEYIRQCGFDYAAGVYRGNLKDHNLDALTVHNMEWVTKGALDFIEQNKNRPFFLHMAPTLQHGPPPAQSLKGDPRITPAGLLPGPLQVQASRQSIYERLKAAGIPENMAHATWLDDAVGALVQKLQELGIADRTAIIMFSDNATMGGKGTCYEGGTRTPALIYWKGHVGPGMVCDKLIQNIDFVPTILDICGARPPAPMHLDGVSLMPLVTGNAAAWRDALYFEIGHTRAICTGRWKYIALRFPPKVQRAIRDGDPPYHMSTSLDLQKTAMRNHPHYGDADQLYDLVVDPKEQKNLATDPQHQETLKEMTARLNTWLGQFDRPFGDFRP